MLDARRVAAVLRLGKLVSDIFFGQTAILYIADRMNRLSRLV